MENIVAEAEKVIKSLVHEDVRGNKRIKCIDLTTSQIRKFLTAVNRTANKVAVYRSQNPQAVAMPEKLAGEIQYLQVQLVYQAGRENDKRGPKPVTEFIDKDHANLIAKIRVIGNSFEKFDEFCRYVEALVAYHRYYGGREK